MIGTNEQEAPSVEGAFPTTRLRSKLTPLELVLYTGEPLPRFLYTGLYAEIGDELIDSWSIDDFVSYGLWQAVRYDSQSRSAVLHWCRQELWKRRRRQKRYFVQADPLKDTAELPQTPSRLDQDTTDWLWWHLPDETAQALVAVAERDITLPEAARELDIDLSVLYRSLRHLQTLIKEETPDEF